MVLVSQNWPRYQISFLWISFVAAAVTYATGWIVTWISRPSQAVDQPEMQTSKVVEGVSL
jgi:hypothetical protein